jgi:uncharacterized membrane protein YphA (DoxX/SURF4 family)
MALLFQGGVYLNNSEPIAATWLVGITAVAAGGLLSIGFLTPIAAAGAALWLACVGSSLFPRPNLFDRGFPIFLSVIMLIAVALLGPGTYSVDARLYGRRKIIIPTSRSPR